MATRLPLRSPSILQLRMWIEVTQNRLQWQAFVNTVMTRPVPQKPSNFMTNLATTHFSGKTCPLEYISGWIVILSVNQSPSTSATKIRMKCSSNMQHETNKRTDYVKLFVFIFNHLISY
jgi:hypothetical protein